MLMVETLEDAGFDILEASGGGESCQLMEDPDRVDIHLPRRAFKRSLRINVAILASRCIVGGDVQLAGNPGIRKSAVVKGDQFRVLRRRPDAFMGHQVELQAWAFP
jgi:hypothetical protein